MYPHPEDFAQIVQHQDQPISAILAKLRCVRHPPWLSWKRLSLSIHELNLHILEPTLSLSVPILAVASAMAEAAASGVLQASSAAGAKGNVVNDIAHTFTVLLKALSLSFISLIHHVFW